MRRSLLLGLLVFAACRERRLEEIVVDLEADAGLVATQAPDRGGLRVSVAAIQSPAHTFGAYSRLLDLLGRKLETPVTLTQRRSYRETNELLTGGRIDVAFVCTGGYLDLRRSGATVDVLAVPVVRGVDTYQSLVIVPARSAAARLEDLAGRRFAFTDELSLSGYAWPNHAVRRRGLEPLRFFSSSYFTHSHDRSIEAVARGFVDGAAVDSNIFEDMVARDAALAAGVRVIERSPPLGIPPVVALGTLDRKRRDDVRRFLLSLHDTPEGAAVLREVGIDRFVAPSPGLYDSAAEVVSEGRSR